MKSFPVHTSPSATSSFPIMKYRLPLVICRFTSASPVLATDRPQQSASRRRWLVPSVRARFLHGTDRAARGKDGQVTSPTKDDGTNMVEQSHGRPRRGKGAVCCWKVARSRINRPTVSLGQYGCVSSLHPCAKVIPSRVCVRFIRSFVNHWHRI